VAHRKIELRTLEKIQGKNRNWASKNTVEISTGTFISKRLFAAKTVIAAAASLYAVG